jgi:regulatory protein
LPVVTALEPEAGRPDRFRLYLDGADAGLVSAQVAADLRLRPGRELSADDLAAIDARETVQRTLDRALRFLTYRPRSEHELRQYLARRVGADPDTITAVLARLRDLRLVDDAAFAQYWATQRATFSPRSRRAVAIELRQRGVPRAAIDEALAAGPDEEEAAYAAAQRKARTLPRGDYAAFRAKLEGHLLRRGFGYTTARAVANRLWAELGGEARAVAEDDAG